MERKISDVLIVVIVVLVGLFAVVDLTRRIYNTVTNKNSNTLAESQQKKSEEVNDFFARTFVKNIENNNKLSRQEKDKLIESYFYNQNLKTDLKNIGYLKNIGNKRVKVSFEIDKSGHISNYRIIESSNDKNTDKKILKAIKKLNPYKPIPIAYNGEPKYVEFVCSKDGISDFKTYPLYNPRAFDDLLASSKIQEQQENFEIINMNTPVRQRDNQYRTNVRARRQLTRDEMRDNGAYTQALSYALEDKGLSTESFENDIKVSFIINQDGRIECCNTEQASDSETEKTVICAVKSLNPFKPLPNSYKELNQKMKVIVSYGKHSSGMTNIPIDN